MPSRPRRLRAPTPDRRLFRALSARTIGGARHSGPSPHSAPSEVRAPRISPPRTLRHALNASSRENPWLPLRLTSSLSRCARSTTRKSCPHPPAGGGGSAPSFPSWLRGFVAFPVPHFVSFALRTVQRAPNASAHGLPRRIRVLSICSLRFALSSPRTLYHAPNASSRENPWLPLRLTSSLRLSVTSSLWRCARSTTRQMRSHPPSPPAVRPWRTSP